MTDAVKHAEIFVRYSNGNIECKIGDGSASITIQKSMLPALRENIVKDPKGGDKMAELFDLLVDQAVKDPEGKWVSASTAPVAEGQAVLGNS